MKIGLIQQSNTANIAENIGKLEKNIREVASRGAELVVLQEIHNGLYFCHTEDVSVLIRQKQFPDHPLKGLESWRKNLEW